MAEATPRPWRAGIGFPEDGQKPIFIRAENVDGQPLVARIYGWANDAKTIANAALIVQAVNAHDNLVAALESARSFITNGIELGYIRNPENGSPESKTLPMIEAALQKVKGVS